MKIVSYNLQFGGRRDADNHWEKMLDSFEPDIVLAQESYSPSDYFPDGYFSKLEKSVVWQKASQNKWGSAIYAPQHEVSKISIPEEFMGWVVGCKINDFSIGNIERTLLVFSVHAPTPGPYDKRVNDILDFIYKISGDSEVLIAGDFNIDTAFRHPSEEIENTPKEKAILERLRRKFGLVNAWQAIHPNTNLTQTLRWSKNKEAPYHCDGIFVPLKWLRYLESCEIVSEGWTETSDHNPVVAEFDF